MVSEDKYDEVNFGFLLYDWLWWIVCVVFIVGVFLSGR